MGRRSSQRRVNVSVVSPDGKVLLADLGEMDVPVTYEAIRRRLYNNPEDTTDGPRRIIPDHKKLKFHHTAVVSLEESCFAPQGNRSINIDENLYSYYSRVYLEKPKTTIKIKDNGRSISIGDLQIILHRTIRVPDNDMTHSLPPSMGNFTIRNVADHAEALPRSVVGKGGAFITMFQREALWMRFSSPTACAIKVSVGGINAITGMPRSSPSNEKQDYIPCHKKANQVWLDGVAVKPGVVRQFVAMPLNEGYTVESQLTGSDDIGGIQFDVFWAKQAPEYYDIDNQRWIRGTDIDKTPRQLGLAEGTRLRIHDPEGFNPWLTTDGSYSFVPLPSEDTVTLSPQVAPFFLDVECSDDSAICVGPLDMNTTISQLKEEIADNIPVNLPIQKLSFNGVTLSDDTATLLDYKIVMAQTLTLDDPVPDLTWEDLGPDQLRSESGEYSGYRGMDSSDKRRSAVLGIAPGGTIAQKIVRDTLPTTAYDQILTSRVHVSIFNSAMSRTIGLPLPTSPVSVHTYIRAGLPWFDLYEENIPAVQLPTAGPLQQLKSVAEKEAEKRDSRGHSGQQEDCGYCTHQMATIALEPCNHFFCDGCSAGLSACPTCSCRVQGKRRFAAPMMVPGQEEHLGVDRLDARIAKLKRAAGTGVIVYFRNAEDDISPLTGGET